MTDERDEVPFVHRRPPEEPALSDVRYPPPRPAQPPPGLSHREERRWRRDSHAAQRAADAEQVRAWRRRPPGSVDALGPVLLVVALLFAAAVWLWPSDDEPTAAPAQPAPSGPVAGPDSRGLPQERNPWTGEPAPDSEDGHDPAPPPPPGELLAGADGMAAYHFVLGYLAYSPAVPDPVEVWALSWAKHATGTVRLRAEEQAPRLWDFTVREAVHVIDPRVVGGSRDSNTWRLQVERTLFPIGGDEDSPTTRQRVDVEVTVTGGLVSAVTVSDSTGQGA